jgi:hypothetical protein
MRSLARMARQCGPTSSPHHPRGLKSGGRSPSKSFALMVGLFRQERMNGSPKHLAGATSRLCCPSPHGLRTASTLGFGKGAHSSYSTTFSPALRDKSLSWPVQLEVGLFQELEVRPNWTSISSIRNSRRRRIRAGIRNRVGFTHLPPVMMNLFQHPLSPAATDQRLYLQRAVHAALGRDARTKFRSSPPHGGR